MAFRRSDDDSPGSSRWRLKHRAQLIRCGIPEAVLESDSSLAYVLLHGDDSYGTGWDTSWLSREESKELLAFLRLHFPIAVGYDLIRILEQRVDLEG
jgi:hypothetical protein